MGICNTKKTEETVDKNIKEREIDYKHSPCIIRSPNDSCKENDYELLKIKPDSVPLFHFGTKPFKARVVDVYDGDTCTILFIYHGINVKHKIRLYGYDSPEIKPRKDVPNREEVIKAAKEAKRVFMEKVMDKTHNRKIVTVQLKPKNEKYGRLLGTIFYKGENINDWMVNNGYGKPYFGGKKI